MLDLPARGRSCIFQGEEAGARDVRLEPDGRPAQLVPHLRRGHLQAARPGVQRLGRPHAPPRHKGASPDAVHKHDVDVRRACMRPASSDKVVKGSVVALNPDHIRERPAACSHADKGAAETGADHALGALLAVSSTGRCGLPGDVVAVPSVASTSWCSAPGSNR